MSYSTITRAMVSYVEGHAADMRLDLKQMGRKFGFSENYIRELFAGQVGVSIMQYYKRRRIILSAAQLLHTDKRILDIALEWGFGSHEAYTRAFARVMGMSPSAFRRARPIVGKAQLRPGVYGLELLEQKEKRSDLSDMKQDRQESIILHDIQQVKYGSYGSATPFPICIKAVSEYLEDSHFASTVYESLFSKLLVQNDATTCLMDGRNQGARYLLELVEKQKDKDNTKLEQAARHFQKVSVSAEEMSHMIGDWSDMDAMLKHLADRKVREKLGQLILDAKGEDEAALRCLKEYLQ